VPIDPVALGEAARAAVTRGEIELALRLAQSAIVANPARIESYNLLGDIYAGNKEPESARNYYNIALTIDPTDHTATQALAALDKGGETRAAQAGPSEGTKSAVP